MMTTMFAIGAACVFVFWMWLIWPGLRERERNSIAELRRVLNPPVIVNEEGKADEAARRILQIVSPQHRAAAGV